MNIKTYRAIVLCSVLNMSLCHFKGRTQKEGLTRRLEEVQAGRAGNIIKDNAIGWSSSIIININNYKCTQNFVEKSLTEDRRIDGRKIKMDVTKQSKWAGIAQSV